MEDLENLRQEFPRLYLSPYVPFECGDGWYTILRRLSLKIMTHLKEDNGHNHTEDEEPFHPCQVKEKFGTLRYYVNHECEYISEIIVQAEKESEKACEVCGELGKMFGQYWMKTRCLKCMDR